jgi:hypothetical protein
MIEMLLKIIYCGLILGSGREHKGGYLTKAQNIIKFYYSILNIILVYMAGQSCAPQGFWLEVYIIFIALAQFKMIFRYSVTKVT